MLIDIYGALLVSSVPSGVLLECGHSPFTLGWNHPPGKCTVGPSASGSTIGDIDKWAYFLTPQNVTTLP